MTREHKAQSAERRAQSGKLPLFCALSFALCALLLWGAAPARADGPHPDELLETARFEQRLNAQVPLDLGFRDETGQAVRLGRYMGAKPIILALAYYDCPNLCNIVLDDLVENLRELPFVLGEQFDVVTVSIDPRETPQLAATKKDSFLRHYGRSDTAGGWHALTGEQAAIQRLADAIGFRYAYDAELGQYAHPSGLLVLTPQGKISRYFYGLVYSPTDLRLGLVEASANKIGSPIDQVLLRCYRYDPVAGKYSVAIMEGVRIAGLLTTLVLGTFIVRAFRRDRGRGPGVGGWGLGTRGRENGPIPSLIQNPKSKIQNIPTPDSQPPTPNPQSPRTE